MNEIFLITICFSFIFAFAFGMAWSLPLMTAHSEQKSVSNNKNQQDVVFGVLDILLSIFGCIPLFKLFRTLPETPSAYKAVRDKWKSEVSIRWSFKAFLVCITLFTSSSIIYFTNTFSGSE